MPRSGLPGGKADRFDDRAGDAEKAYERIVEFWTYTLPLDGSGEANSGMILESWISQFGEISYYC